MEYDAFNFYEYWRNKDHYQSWWKKFVVGGEVTVVSEINGNMIVNVKDSRVAIGKDMAAKIMV